MAGYVQIRLVAGRSGTVSGSAADLAQAGANAATGVSNGLPYLVWRNPMFTP